MNIEIKKQLAILEALCKDDGVTMVAGLMGNTGELQLVGTGINSVQVGILEVIKAHVMHQLTSTLKQG